MSINEKNLNLLEQPLVTGQRVIRIGDKLIPVGIGGKYIIKPSEVTQPQPNISISGSIVTAEYIPLSGNTKDISIKSTQLDLTTIEQNLIPQNIKSGVEIFGITGLHLGGDISIQPGYLTKNTIFDEITFHSSENPSGEVVSALYYIDINDLAQPIYTGDEDSSSITFEEKIQANPNLLHIFQIKQNQLICNVGGRPFYKTYGGWAIGAGYHCSDSGWGRALLISNTQDGAKISQSSPGSGWQAVGLRNWTITYHGITFYISGDGYAMSSNSFTIKDGLLKYETTQTDFPNILYDLLDRYFRFKENE